MPEDPQCWDTLVPAVPREAPGPSAGKLRPQRHWKQDTEALRVEQALTLESEARPVPTAGSGERGFRGLGSMPVCNHGRNRAFHCRCCVHMAQPTARPAWGGGRAAPTTPCPAPTTPLGAQGPAVPRGTGPPWVPPPRSLMEMHSTTTSSVCLTRRRHTDCTGHAPAHTQTSRAAATQLQGLAPLTQQPGGQQGTWEPSGKHPRTRYTGSAQ